MARLTNCQNNTRLTNPDKFYALGSARLTEVINCSNMLVKNNTSAEVTFDSAPKFLYYVLVSALCCNVLQETEMFTSVLKSK